MENTLTNMISDLKSLYNFQQKKINDIDVLKQEHFETQDLLFEQIKSLQLKVDEMTQEYVEKVNELKQKYETMKKEKENEIVELKQENMNLVANFDELKSELNELKKMMYASPKLSFHLMTNNYEPYMIFIPNELLEFIEWKINPFTENLKACLKRVSPNFNPLKCNIWENQLYNTLNEDKYSVIYSESSDIDVSNAKKGIYNSKKVIDFLNAAKQLPNVKMITRCVNRNTEFYIDLY